MSIFFSAKKEVPHMTTHVIEVEVRRFYKVYVDNENYTMTEAEAEQQAR